MLTFDPVTALAIYKVPVAGQEVSFGIGPTVYTDFLQSYDWGMRNGLLEIQGQEIAAPGIGAVALDNYNLLRRIKSWEGIVDPQGEPVPCTEANKLLFFARYPEALPNLAEQLRQAETAETKNSETSPLG